MNLQLLSEKCQLIQQKKNQEKGSNEKCMDLTGVFVHPRMEHFISFLIKKKRFFRNFSLMDMKKKDLLGLLMRLNNWRIFCDWDFSWIKCLSMFDKALIELDK